MSGVIVTQGLGATFGVVVSQGYGDALILGYIFDITLPISTGSVDIITPIMDTEGNIVFPITTSEDMTTPIESTKNVTVPITKEDDVY